MRGDEHVSLELHVSLERTERRIELEQMRECRRFGEVVDENDVHVGMLLQNDAQYLASDASESVDGDVHCGDGRW